MIICGTILATFALLPDKNDFVDHHCKTVSVLHSIRIYHECEDGIEKSVTKKTILHHDACLMMTNGDLEGQFFYPILTQIMEYFLPRY